MVARLTLDLALAYLYEGVKGCFSAPVSKHYFILHSVVCLCMYRLYSQAKYASVGRVSAYHHCITTRSGRPPWGSPVPGICRALPCAAFRRASIHFCKYSGSFIYR